MKYTPEEARARAQACIDALKKSGGNISQAAAALGMDRSTFKHWVQRAEVRFGIKPPRVEPGVVHGGTARREIPEAEIREVVDAAARYGQQGAADRLGRSGSYVHRRMVEAAKRGIRADVPHDSEPDAVQEDLRLVAARDENRRLNQKVRTLVKQLEEASDQLNALQEMAEVCSEADVPRFRIERSKRGGTEATAFAMAGDWHCEEHVDPATINGLNEFNLEICERRVKRFFDRIVRLVDIHRREARIDNLVLGLLGDFINGHIHEEYLQTNLLSPPEATVFAYQLLCGGIDFLLEHGKFKRITLPCAPGNHGRTTKKPTTATATANNFETMLYKLIADRYRDEPRIQFKIASGYHVFLQVYNQVHRFHHGDAIVYRGGAAGIYASLLTSIGRWNQTIRADCDWLQHWHQDKRAPEFILGGCVVGYNAYAQKKLKAPRECPSQSFAIVLPNGRRVADSPIYVDDVPEAVLSGAA